MELFDTYSKRTPIYYILLCLFLLPALICLLTIIKIIPVQSGVFKFFAFIGIVSFAAYLFLNNSFLKMYTVDGKIEISDHFIKINDNRLKLEEITKIVVNATEYKGNRRGTSDGSGNRIEIYINNEKVHDLTFVIKSYLQLNNLNAIMAKLSEKGIFITQNGF
jgi:hypothetical protein